LMRSLGRELIVSIDRITLPLRKGDEVILCSDGLYNVLESHDLMSLTREFSAQEACEKLIRNANHRGTHDNITVALFRQLAETPDTPPMGLLGRLKNLFSR
jgi:serine/threonine protein phosphatase PrpC